MRVWQNLNDINSQMMGLALAGLVFFGGTSSATADLLQWGTNAYASIRDAPLSGGSLNETLVGSRGIFEGVMTSSSHALVDDAVTLDSFGNGPWNRGVAEASSQLQFATNEIPELKARAILTGNTADRDDVTVLGASAFARSSAVELFQYTGAVPSTLTLTLTLDGEVQKGFSGSLTGLFGSLGVFEENENTNFIYSTDRGTIFEFGGDPKQDVSPGSNGGAAFVDVSIRDDTGGVKDTVSGSVTIDVIPDEVFYVFTALSANANQDNDFADAFGTLQATFDDPSVVTIHNVIIPEPATATFLLSLGVWVGVTSIRRHVSI